MILKKIIKQTQIKQFLGIYLSSKHSSIIQLMDLFQYFFVRQREVDHSRALGRQAVLPTKVLIRIQGTLSQGMLCELSDGSQSRTGIVSREGVLKMMNVEMFLKLFMGNKMIWMGGGLRAVPYPGCSEDHLYYRDRTSQRIGKHPLLFGWTFLIRPVAGSYS